MLLELDITCRNPSLTSLQGELSLDNPGITEMVTISPLLIRNTFALFYFRSASSKIRFPSFDSSNCSGEMADFSK